MSELPAGWSEARLPDVADNLDSMRVPVNRTERTKRLGSVPYYGATGQVGWIDQPLFNEELVLVGEDGAPFLDRDKQKAYIISGPSWVNNHAHVLRALAEGTSNRYLKHLLDWIDYRPFVNGTTRLKLTKAGLNRIPMPIAPLNEQRRIVAAIEEHLSRLDAGDALLAGASRRLDALHRSALASAMNGGWVRRPLGEVAETQLGKMLSGKSKTGVGSRPYLRNKNVQWGRIDTDDLLTMDFNGREVAKFSLVPGDVLVCEGGEVGRAAVWHGQVEGCCFQKALHRVRSNGELLPEFIAYAFRWLSDRKAFDAHVTGSTIKHLPQEDLRLIPIPLPSLEEQRRIVAEIDERLGRIDALRAAIERAQRRSAALRRAVLERAFRGELVPQDPSDEPASVLLDRVRAETAKSGTTTGRRRKAVRP